MRTRTVAATVAGWLLVITGVGHTTLVAISSAATASAADTAIRDAMAAAPVTVAGLERSYWDLYLGFSLMMALMLVGLGALVLLVLRRAPELVARGMVVLLALVLVPAWAISALLLPPPPIVLLGAAAVAVVSAAVLRPRSTRVQQPVPADIFDM